MENVALWHERDISHSSVERIIFPDSTILADYLIDRTATLIEKLVVYPERMKQNLELTHGLIYSGELLLELVAKNVTREDAYRWVQRNAMRVWDEGGTFKDKVLSDANIAKVFATGNGVPPMSTQQVVEQVLINHVNEHLGSIRAVVGAK